MIVSEIVNLIATIEFVILCGAIIVAFIAIIYNAFQIRKEQKKAEIIQTAIDSIDRQQEKKQLAEKFCETDKLAKQVMDWKLDLDENGRMTWLDKTKLNCEDCRFYGSTTKDGKIICKLGMLAKEEKPEDKPKVAFHNNIESSL